VREAQQSHLIEILCVLVDKGVQFVVAGGTAILLHGIQRMTLDLDIAVSPDRTNLLRFISTLNQLKFVPRAPVPAETILNRERVEMLIREKNALVFTFWCPGDPYKQIDMFLTRENSFDGLVSDARKLTVCGRTVLVASRRKLIEMKRRVEPIREQDLSDIQALQIIEKSAQVSESAVVTPGFIP
jgi:Nucleotidyl transferase AbiEii toxin, Type IV TA system